jgi:phage gp36-like protein
MYIDKEYLQIIFGAKEIKKLFDDDDNHINFCIQKASAEIDGHMQEAGYKLPFTHEQNHLKMIASFLVLDYSGKQIDENIKQEIEGKRKLLKQYADEKFGACTNEEKQKILPN